MRDRRKVVKDMIETGFDGLNQLMVNGWIDRGRQILDERRKS